MNNDRITDSCMFCNNQQHEEVFNFSKPPALETNFSTSKIDKYKRIIVRCTNCGHFYSRHNIDLSSLYEGEYNKSTYKDTKGMKQTFDRIINLEQKNSDNQGRCDRIEKFIIKNTPNKTPGETTVLDIGSGLGVFPWEMRQRKYNITALDPDPAAIEHIKETVKIPTILGDFFSIESTQHFDLICLNKVLEHVERPIEMLTKTIDFLTTNGIVYIELPDGEIASQHGADREEFVIDHLHIFSFNSLSLLASKAGFHIIEMERLKEPSTKYSLRAFLKNNKDHY